MKELARRHGPGFCVGAVVVWALVLVVGWWPGPQQATITLEAELAEVEHGSVPGLSPAFAASHYYHPPSQLFYKDSIVFYCGTPCSSGEEWRIKSIEFLRDKILRVLGSSGSAKAKLLLGLLPPDRSHAAYVKDPFPDWSLPTAWTPGDETITTKPLEAKFKGYRSTQVYAITWETRTDPDDQDPIEYDPHIYAHGGKRR